MSLTPALTRLLKPNDFFWKKAITGCALSHLGLWWKLATDNPSIQNYLILEDDVKFKRNWETAWKSAVENGDVPDDYEIIYLGGVLPPNRQGFEAMCKERVNDSFCRIAENQTWGQSKPTRYFHFCAYAYVLSRRGAQKVIELISQMNGYWTSADHILCNPVDVLKSYVLDPMVAGCYQDDDPKYAGADFNNFSRIDGFDSDLWNNDERFSAEEIAATTVEGAELDIPRALAEARGVAITSGAKPVDTIGAPGGRAVAQEALKGVAAEPVPATPVKKVLDGIGAAATPKLMPRRLICLKEHNLDLSQLLECEWLVELFGKPAIVEIARMQPNEPAPTDEPVLIVQRPHLPALIHMMERWNDAGAKFHVLHLSDEFANGRDGDPVDFYALEGCKSVVRTYQRTGVPCPEKVMTIPLGYHWTLREGSRDPLRLTPHLPFRTLVWSFFGTEWGGRRGLLKPLLDVPSLKHEARFYRSWNDVECLKKEPYIQILLDSVFVPCPDGMNPETFRFYEALEAGCIPVLVRTEQNAGWVDWVSEHLQLLPMPSWEEAAKFMGHLMERPEMLELYREKVLTAWRDWKQQLCGAVQKWLQKGTVTEDP